MSTLPLEAPRPAEQEELAARDGTREARKTGHERLTGSQADGDGVEDNAKRGPTEGDISRSDLARSVSLLATGEEKQQAFLRRHVDQRNIEAEDSATQTEEPYRANTSHELPGTHR